MHEVKNQNIEFNFKLCHTRGKFDSMSYSHLEFDLSLHGHLLDVDETLVSKGLTLLNLQNITSQ